MSLSKEEQSLSASDERTKSLVKNIIEDLVFKQDDVSGPNPYCLAEKKLEFFMFELRRNENRRNVDLANLCSKLLFERITLLALEKS